MDVLHAALQPVMLAKLKSPELKSTVPTLLAKLISLELKSTIPNDGTTSPMRRQRSRPPPPRKSSSMSQLDYRVTAKTVPHQLPMLTVHSHRSTCISAGGNFVSPLSLSYPRTVTSSIARNEDSFSSPKGTPTRQNSWLTKSYPSLRTATSLARRNEDSYSSPKGTPTSQDRCLKKSDSFTLRTATSPAARNDDSYSSPKGAPTSHDRSVTFSLRTATSPAARNDDSYSSPKGTPTSQNSWLTKSYPSLRTATSPARRNDDSYSLPKRPPTSDDWSVSFTLRTATSPLARNDDSCYSRKGQSTSGVPFSSQFSNDLTSVKSPGARKEDSYHSHKGQSASGGQCLLPEVSSELTLSVKSPPARTGSYYLHMGTPTSRVLSQSASGTLINPANSSLSRLATRVDSEVVLGVFHIQA
jgi:hypothetical protein